MSIYILYNDFRVVIEKMYCFIVKKLLFLTDKDIV